jgi:hypothetical protein
VFAGDKSVQSPLEIVMASSRDMAVWEPFRNNVDMDLQVYLILLPVVVEFDIANGCSYMSLHSYKRNSLLTKESCYNGNLLKETCCKSNCK